MEYPYYLPQEPKEPLDEKLMLFFSIPDFGISPLAFWKFVKEKGYKTAWIVQKREIFEKMRDMGIECVLLEDTEKVRHYFSTAKYFLFNRDIPYGYPKLKGQIYVHLFSTVTLSGEGFAGSSGIFDPQKFESTLIGYIMYYKWLVTMTDISIVTSELCRRVYASGYYANALKVFATGSPHHDTMLLNDGKSILSNNMPQIKKYASLIGYFPTHSAGRERLGLKCFEENIFNIKGLDICALETFLEENNIAVIMKLHPVDERNFLENRIKIPNHCYLINSNSFFNYSHLDILNAFDILISDRSTISNDFLLLDRPLIYFPEIADFTWERLRAGYQNPYLIERDIYFPGHEVYTPDDFFSAIIESLANPGKYSAKRKILRDLMFKYQDPDSCKRVLDVIENCSLLEQPIEYEMFTAPLTKRYEAQIVKHDQTIAECGQAIAERDNELDNIKNSRAYKLVLIPSKIFYPEGSRRRVLYILMKKTIRHPVMMLKKLKPGNIKALVSELRR